MPKKAPLKLVTSIRKYEMLAVSVTDIVLEYSGKQAEKSAFRGDSRHRATMRVNFPCGSIEFEVDEGTCVQIANTLYEMADHLAKPKKPTDT